MNLLCHRFYLVTVLFVSSFLISSVWSQCTTTSTFSVGSCTPQVRRDWSGLTAAEKTAYGNAFKTFSSTCQPTVPNNICYFACRYADALNSLGSNNILLYHKMLLLEIEAVLRVQTGNPSFTIPYADFEPAFLLPYFYDFLNFIPQGPLDGVSCVNWASGVFSGLSTCVKRKHTLKQVNQEDYRKARGTSKFKNFNTLITQGFLKLVHENYGGTMTQTSTNSNPMFDPIFLLHIANAQRLLFDWQTRNPGSVPSELANSVPQYTTPSNSLWNTNYGCITYQAPTYSPLQPIIDAIDSFFGGFFGGNFWGGSKKRQTGVGIDELAASVSQLVTDGYAQQFFHNLSSSNSLGYDLKHFLEGVYLEDSDSIPPGLSESDLVQAVFPQLYYGSGFEYAVSFGVAFQQFQTQGKGLWKLGAKFDQGRPNFIMAQILSVVREQESLQDFTDSIAQLYSLASKPADPADVPTKQELAEAGKQIILRFAGILSPATVLSTTAVAPPGWICPSAYYGAGDGCDCNCGESDPDCALPSSPFSTDIPIFGCWGMPSPSCYNGTTCIPGPPPPPGWNCTAERYNSTDGCDCNCGIQDPDCNNEYTGNLNKIAPYLYRAAGCTGGIGGVCEDGKCVYAREVPSNWTCPQEDYGSGGFCDCSCGAFDPDCSTNQNVRGCGCPGLTCKNSLGLCEGSCSTGTTVKLASTTTTPYCSGSSSLSPSQNQSSVATCPHGGQAQVSSSFLQLLSLTKLQQTSP